MDETELIRRAGEGDEDAFEGLVWAHAGSVYAYALDAAGNRDDALDLTQAAFRRAWNGIGLFQFDCDFSEWIRRITADVCAKQIRKPRLEEQTPLSEDALCASVMNAIRQERARQHPRALLKRMRFTLIALVIAALLLLASRLGPGGQGRTEKAPPSATAAPSAPPAEFHAGT